ncbi:MAG: GNAT family N-acetyltransferase [Bdellovibrionota bacterium]
MIETARLLLRRWREEDLEPFARLNADPRVMEFFPSTMTLEQSAMLMARIENEFGKKGYDVWACEEKVSGKFIGFTGLTIPWFEAAFTPCVEIGWRLAYEFWGKGYAPEAAAAALKFGFRELGLAEIVSFTARVNLRSIRVMEKIGMEAVPANDFEHPRVAEGHLLRPHVFYRKRALD